MSELQGRFAKLMFGHATRVRVYRQLERLLRNGIPVHKALDEIYRRASKDQRKPDNPDAHVIDQWRSAYKNGTPLGRAAQGWIPYQEQMLIEAGELSGNIPHALRAVVEISTSSARIRGALIGGLAYPLALFLVILAMLYGFGRFIIPPFGEILEPHKWVGGAGQMRVLSELVRVWTLPALIAVFGLLTLYASTVAIWTGRIRVLFDRISPWSMYRMYAGTGFLISLAALIRAGVAVPEALRRLKRHASPYLAERIEATLYHINSGANLGEALQRTETNFPDREIIDDLRVYAALQGFEDALEQIAHEWLEMTVERVRAQARILNNLMLFILAGMIGWLAWGLFELQKQVTGSASGF